MMKLRRILFFFVFCCFSVSYSMESASKAGKLLTKRKNLKSEKRRIKKDLIKDKKKLSKLFNKSLEIYLKKPFDHEDHYVNELHSRVLQKINFNQEQLELIEFQEKKSLKDLKSEISLSGEVLEEKNIDPVRYFQAIKRARSYLDNLIKEEGLEKADCKKNLAKNFLCFSKTDKSPEKTYPSEDLIKIKKDLYVFIKEYESETKTKDLGRFNVEMSFFVNGVIVSKGDLK